MQDDNYFTIVKTVTLVTFQTQLTIIFVHYLKDVIFDNTSTIIPCTNGSYYNVYQDIGFKILDAFKEQNISASVLIDNDTPSIIIEFLSNETQEIKIIDIITIIINKNINRKFSLIY
jgi:hypothetical protein